MTDDPRADPAAIPDDEAIAILGAPAVAMELLGHSTLGPTRGVARVAAANRRRAIRKVVGPRDDDRAAASRRPDSYQFWARELTVLAGGLPSAYLDAGLRAPRLLGRFDQADGAVALWLEEVVGRSSALVGVTDLAEFARRLGLAQGRLVAADVAWRSRGFLREFVEGRSTRPGSEWRLEPDDPRWERPTMAAVDRPLREALIRLQRDRQQLIGWVESGQRTIAHLDAWPTNIFVDDAATDGAIVLIDWAFAGEGALGEDIGNLVPDSVLDMLHPPSILGPLDRAVFRAYVDGLRAAGWDGDEREIRLAMCASAVKYDCTVAGMLIRSDRSDQHTYGTAPPVSTGELYAVRAEVMRFLAGWADEARRLASELGRA